uniref:Immunoglobulin V-set domain-containing protein n=1 Tax=Salarias fasciatus TaxID=181472 RepID=A0A672JUB4_SALFA
MFPDCVHDFQAVLDLILKVQRCQTGSSGVSPASGANNFLWKHNRDKVVEFNRNEQLEYPPFKDRITLDWHTAALEITDLRYEDSGDYELGVFVKKEFRSFPLKLKVIGECFSCFFYFLFLTIYF